MFTGLTIVQLKSLRQIHQKNVFMAEPEKGIAQILLQLFKDPMILLLFVAAGIYFLTGETAEGLLMLIAIIFVYSISAYQEVKGANALAKLNQWSEPKVKVIRDGVESIILSSDLYPGDIMRLEEGMLIPADAYVLQQNDLTVNESIITGESMAVSKNLSAADNRLYQGTVINSGQCMAQVTETGLNTILGKLGKAISINDPVKTVLQLQLSKFLKIFTFAGIVIFLLVFFINFFNGHTWLTSLMFALTLSMSIIPEEIPVAFTSFIALGANRMSQNGIIARQPQAVENLGKVSILCLDKTGTITQNKMQVVEVYIAPIDKLANLEERAQPAAHRLLHFGMLASEEAPFDAMEKAITNALKKNNSEKVYEHPKIMYEYPLAGQPPMMTHIYESGGHAQLIVASKGAAEKIIQVCSMPVDEEMKANKILHELGRKGYRVIGVASATHESNITLPVTQELFDWHFEGLLAIYDPPKENCRRVIKELYQAGVTIKLLTGDHADVAMQTASSVGISCQEGFLSGKQISEMTSELLADAVQRIHVYARMFPEAKRKVITALQKNGEICAMTGDGVNDGPALKAADIGIAMGNGGTGVARVASDLILTDDNLEKIKLAILEGRKIANNFKKAVRYILSIHIPIILVVSLPLILNWRYANLFTPVHIIFLELIMGPTCSIFFEKEPYEEHISPVKGNKRNTRLFSNSQMAVSVFQGLMMATGVLAAYYYYMMNNATIGTTRSVVFTMLILCNLLLTFVDRSFTRSVVHTSKYHNKLAFLIIISSAFFLVMIHLVPPVTHLFGFDSISFLQFLVCLTISLVSVGWFEVYKSTRQWLVGIRALSITSYLD